MIQPTFHNVAEAEPLPGLPGVYLQRYPRAVREQLTNAARQSAQDNSGVEIRIKTAAPQMRITLTAHVGDEGEAVLYKGAFEHTKYKLPHGVTSTLSLPHMADFFTGQPAAQLHAGGFANDVWRLRLHRCAVRFHGVDTFGHPLLPIEPGDTPRVRWLAYGSSITHAWLDGHVFMAAKLLEVDVLNKGLGGGCHAEPAVAEFLATQACDLLSFELGINMLRAFSPDTFEPQVREFLRILRAARPKLPMVMISPFRNGLETSKQADPKEGNQLRAFRAILANIFAAANDPLLTFIDGDTILDRFSLLRADLIHPSTHGHAIMGTNLAKQLQPLVDQLKLARSITA